MGDENHSTGENRARGKETLAGTGGWRPLHQGLLFEAGKLSKHSNLRKSCFLLTGGSQEMGWGGRAPFQEAPVVLGRGSPLPGSPGILSRVCTI